MPSIISGQHLGLINSSLSSAIGNVLGDAVLGQNNNQIYVNSSTGNLVIQQQDLMLVGAGYDGSFWRTYNSQGYLSDQEQFLFSWQKQIHGSYFDQVVKIENGDGSYAVFEYSHTDGDGKHYRSTDGGGAHDTLSYQAHQWVFTDGSSHERYTFGNSLKDNNKLIAVEDRDGKLLQLTYNLHGDIESIQDASGQKIVFSYDWIHGARKLVNINTWNNDSFLSGVHYQFDYLGRLSKVLVDLDPSDQKIDDNDDGVIDDQVDAVYITEYEYYEPGHYIGHQQIYAHHQLIKSIKQSDGSAVRFGYVWSSEGWKVKSTVTGTGDNQLIQRYDYFERRTDITQVIDATYEPEWDTELVTQGPSGYGLTHSFEYDELGRLYRVITPADENGQRLVTSYKYDADDNIIAVTDGRNQTTHFTFDERGNQTAWLDAQGNYGQAIYSEYNQILRNTTYLQPDPDGLGPQQAAQTVQQWFVYDPHQRLRFTVQSDGQVLENRYDDTDPSRRLRSDLVYTEHFYPIEALTPDTLLTEQDLENWVAQLSIYIGVQRTDHYFDFRDQLSQTLSYERTNPTTGFGEGEVSVQRYVYNEKGLLLRELTSRNELDAADSDALAQLIDGAWPESMTFDEKSYAFDGMGRLISDTDALGKQTTYQYGVGNQFNRGTIATTNAQGLQVIKVMNSAGLNIASIEQDVREGSATVLGEAKNFFDNMGRLIAKLDETGVLTHTLYDDIGREIAVIDGTGALTEYRYNENNLLIEEIHYASLLARDVLSSLLVKDDNNQLLGIQHPNKHDFPDLLVKLRPEHNDSDRHLFYFYDGADRLTYSVDGEGAISKRIYDGRGNLVTEIGFAEQRGVEAVRDLLNPKLNIADIAQAINTGTAEVLPPSDVHSTQLMDGRYVTVWQQDHKIYAQLFNADASASGELILVQDATGDRDLTMTPVVTALKDGGFAVFWEGMDPYEWDPKPQLHWQRFYADGSRKRHNNFLSGFPYYEEGKNPAVTTLEDGSVVVVQQIYRRASTFPVTGWDLHAVRLAWDEQEQELGTISPDLSYGIVSFDHDSEVNVAIDALDNGGFIMSWSGADADGNGIKGKRYYKDGIDNEQFIDDDFFINQLQLDEQNYPSVTYLKGGEFFVTWQTQNANGEVSIQTRRFSADRFEVLSELHIATAVQATQPKIAQFDDGSLLFAWTVYEGNEYQLHGQHFDALGVAKNPSVVIAKNSQEITEIELSPLYGNRMLVNWAQQNSDSQHTELFQKTLAIPSDPVVRDDWYSADNRVAHTLFDHSDRVVGEIDAAGYLTEYVYNAGNQLIEIHHFAKAVNEGYFDQGLLTSSDIDLLRPSSDSKDRVERHYYDQRNLLVAAVDAGNYLTHYDYDGAGNLVSEKRYYDAVDFSALTSDRVTAELLANRINGEYREITREYNARGDLLSETDWNGLKTEYSYDALRRITGKRSYDARTYVPSDIREAKLSYDLQGRLITEQNGIALLRGEATINRFDKSGRLITTTDTSGYETLYIYDRSDRITHRINAHGEVQQVSYNAFGEVELIKHYQAKLSTEQLLGVQAGLITLSTQQILAAFALQSQIGASLTRTAYDKRGLAVAMVEGEGELTEKVYNVFGEMITLNESINRDTNSQAKTSYTYDKRGYVSGLAQRVQGFDDVANHFVRQSYRYDAFGQQSMLVDGNGHHQQSEYDGLGRLVSMQRSGELIASVAYDAFGRELSKTNALSFETSITYDDMRRSTVITTPEGIDTIRIANAYDQEITLIDGNNNTTTFSYDVNGNQISKENAANQVRRGVYNAKNELIEATDLRGVDTVYNYDAQSRQLSQTIDPSGLALTTTYRYDGIGQQVASVDPKGVTTWFFYDSSKRRIAEVVDPQGLQLATRFFYDDQGNTTKVEQGEFSIPDGLTYDAINWTELAITKTTEWHYDALRRVTKERIESIQNGKLVIDEVAYQLDDNGNILREDHSNGFWIVNNYDDRNQLSRRLSATGLTESMHYNQQGQLVAQTQFATKGYTKSNGLIVLPDENDDYDRSEFYIYDRDNRLVLKVDSEAAVIESDFDANSNVRKTTEYAQRQTELVTWLKQRLQEEARLSTSLLDQAKGLIVTSNDDRVVYQGFDVLDRVSAEIDAMGYLSQFYYDADNNVVAKIQYDEAIQFGAAQAQVFVANIVAASTYQAPIIADNSNTITAFSFFDALGREIASIDGENYLAVMHYDGQDNVIATIKRREALSTLEKTQLLESLHTAVDLSLFSDYLDTRDKRVSSALYDAAQRLVEETNYDGTISQWQYDALDRMTGSVSGLYKDVDGELLDDEARRRKTIRDAYGRVIETQDSKDQDYDIIVKKYFDEGGRLIKTVDAKQQATWLFYEDGANFLSYSVNAMGEVTAYHHNVFGEREAITHYANRIDVTDLQGGSESALLALLQTDHDRDSHLVTEYDRRGQIVANIDAENNRVSTRYNAFGEAILFSQSKTSGEVVSSAFVYDKKGLQTQRYIDAQLDEQGQVLSAAVTLQQEYDAFGREVLSYNGKNNASQTVYDRLGRVISVMDPLGRAIDTEIDAFNRVIRETDALDRTTHYAFDDQARSVTVTLANGLKTVSSKNRHGEVIQVIDTDDSVVQYQYDKQGNILTIVRGLGSEEEKVESSHYDANNLVSAYFNGEYETQYVYDAANRKIVETIEPGGLNATVQYQYDAKSNLIRKLDADQLETLYAYDRNNREILKVIDPKGQAYFMALSYDDFGNVINERHGEFTGVIAEGEELQSYLAAQSLQAVTTSKSYVFDRRNRLQEHLINGETKALLNYDQNDKISSKTDARGNTDHYLYDNADQLLYTVKANGLVTRMVYDDKGNQIRRIQFNELLANSDPISQAHLDSVYEQLTSEDKVLTTLYNAIDQKIAEIDSEGYVTQWRYSDNREIASIKKPAGKLTLSNTLLLASDSESYAAIQQQIAQSIEQFVASADSVRVQYYTYDQLGRIAFEIDAAGFVKELRYTPAGEIAGVNRYAMPLHFEQAPSTEVLRSLLTQNGDLASGSFTEPPIQPYSLEIGNNFNQQSEETVAVNLIATTREPNQPFVISRQSAVAVQSIEEQFIVKVNNTAVLGDNPYLADEQLILQQTPIAVIEDEEAAANLLISQPGLSINLSTPSNLARYQDSDFYRTLNTYPNLGDAPLAIYAVIFDTNGQAVDIAETNLTRQYDYYEYVRDEAGNIVVDDSGAAQTTLVDSSYQSAVNWNGKVNLGANALTNGTYRAEYYLSRTQLPTDIRNEDGSVNTVQLLAHQQTRINELLESEFDVGLLERGQTQFSFDYAMAPAQTQRVLVSYRHSDANDFIEAKEVLLVWNSETLAYEYQVVLDDINDWADEGEIAYNISFFDALDNTLREVQGQIEFRLAEDTQTVSDVSVRTVNASQERSVLKNFIEPELHAHVETIKLNLWQYETDSFGQVKLDSQGQAIKNLVLSDITTDYRHVSDTGLEPGDINLTSFGALADGKYHIEYDLQMASDEFSDQVGSVALEVGQQALVQQRLLWRELEPDITQLAVFVFDDSGESTQFIVNKEDEQFILDLSLRAERIYQIKVLAKSNTGDVLSIGHGNVDTANLITGLENTLTWQTEKVIAGGEGSRLNGLLSSEELVNITTINASVYQYNDRNHLIAEATTYFADYTKLGLINENKVNVSQGTALVDGDYWIVLEKVKRNGDVESQAFRYQIGEQIDQAQALTTFTLPNIKALSGDSLKARYWPLEESSSTAKILNSHFDTTTNQWQISARNSDLIPGDYRMAFEGLNVDGEKRVYWSLLKVRTNAFGELESSLRWDDIRTQSVKRSELRYDARGRIRFEITDYDNTGRAFVTETEYREIIAESRVVKKRYASTIVFNANMSTVDIELAVKDLSASQVTETVMNKQGQVVETIEHVLDAANTLITSTAKYNAMGWQESAISESGYQQYNTFDSEGRVVRQYLPMGVSTAAQVHIVDLGYSELGETGYYTEYEYDAFGNKTKEIVYMDPLPYEADRDFDLFPLQGRARITEWTYDSLNRVQLTTIKDEDDNILISEKVDYDAYGNKAFVIKGFGTERALTTRYVWDTTNRLKQEIQAFGTPLERTKTYAYDEFGQATRIVNEKQQETLRYFDARGEIIAQSNGEEEVRTTVLDAYGNIVKLIDPQGASSHFFYDAQNVLRFMVDASGKITETRYNSNHQQTDIIIYANRLFGVDESFSFSEIVEKVQALASDNDQHTRRILDGLGREIAIIEDFDTNLAWQDQIAITRYQLDAAGNRIVETDSRGHSTVRIFDAQNRERFILRANGEETIKSYDVFNRLLVEGEYGQVADNAFYYDGLGRELYAANINQLLSDGDLEPTFERNSESVDTHALSSLAVGLLRDFDIHGNVISERDGKGNYQYYFYNARQQKVASVDNEGILTLLQYDELDNVTLRRTYNSALTQLNVEQWRQALFYTVGLDEFALIFGIGEDDNYRQTETLYDAANREIGSKSLAVANFDRQLGWHTSVLSTAIHYDDRGNVFSMTDPQGNTTFYLFNDVNQLLLEVNANGEVLQYQYDTFGNRTLEKRFAERLTADRLQMLNYDQTMESWLDGLSGSNARVTHYRFDQLNRQTHKIVENFEYGVNRTQSLAVTVMAYRENGIDTGSDKVTEIIQAAYVAANTNAVNEVIHNSLQLSFNDQQWIAIGNVERESLVYDALGRVTATVSSPYAGVDDAWQVKTLQQKTEYQYNYHNKVISQQLLNDSEQVIKQQRMTYDGTLLRSSSGYQGYQTFIYDDNGNLREKMDYTRRSVEVFTYDKNDRRVTKETRQMDSAAILETTRYRYNGYDEIIEKSTNGIVTEYFDYDAAGRVIQTNAKDGVSRYLAYDKAGNVTMELRPRDRNIIRGQSLQSFLDSLSESDAIKLTIMDYDAKRQLEAEHVVTEQQIRWSDLQQLNALQGKLRRQMAYQYTIFGEVAAKIDGRGHISEMKYDVLGHRIQEQMASAEITAPNGQVSRSAASRYFYFDVLGREIGQRDANGNLTTRSYTGQMLQSVNYANGDYEVYYYDALGDRREVIKGNGSRIDYRRRTQMDYTKARTDISGSYLIDFQDGQWGDGRIQAVTWLTEDDGSGEFDRTVQVRDTDGRTLRSQRFDNQVYSLYYDSSRNDDGDSWNKLYAHNSRNIAWTVSNEYDALGRQLRSVSSESGTQAYSYAIFSDASGNGIKTTENRYAPGRSESVSNELYHDYYGKELRSKNMAGVIYQHTYNAMGLVQQTTSTAGKNQENVYDHYGRLNRVNEQGQLTAEMRYDDNNNIIYEKLLADGLTRETSATYDENNRLTRLDFADYSIRYYLDANGNRVRVYSRKPGRTLQNHWYSYDARNQMTIVKGTLRGGQIIRGTNGVQLNYDGMGHRIVEVNKDGRIEYSYNNRGQLSDAWLEASGRSIHLIDREYYNNGKLRKLVERDKDNKLLTSKTSYYDAHGRLIYEFDSADQEGQKESKTGTLYDAYGNVRQVVSKILTTDDVTDTYVQTTNYRRGNNWLRDNVRMQGTTNRDKIPNGDWRDGYSQFYYDESYNLTQVNKYEVGRNQGPGDLKSTVNYKNDYRGMVHYRSGEEAEDFYYFLGKNIGEGENFDLQYQGIDSGLSRYTYQVRKSDSLLGIAASLYGDSSLWYLLADANGLSSPTAIHPGQQLIVPQTASSQHNTDQSFKPYDLNTVVGDTGSSVADTPAPKKSCGDIVVIITAIVAAVIVAVVISVATFGAASAAGGGLVASVAIGVLGGAVGGAASSAVSQGILIAGGQQESFSLEDFGKSIVIGAATGFISGALGSVAKGAEGASKAATAIGKGADAAAKVTSSTINFAKIAARTVSVLKVAAKGALQGATGSFAGVAYDMAIGRQVNINEIWIGALQGAVAGVGGAAGKAAGGAVDKTSKNLRNAIDFALDSVVSVGAAYGAAYLRSKVWGRPFNFVDASLEAIGDIAGNAIVASRGSRGAAYNAGYRLMTTGRGVFKGAYNLQRHGFKNAVTSFQHQTTRAKENLSREWGVKAVQPNQLQKFSGKHARLVIADHGGFKTIDGPNGRQQEFVVAGQTAKELARSIEESGIQELETLSLAACAAGHPNSKTASGKNFAAELFSELNSLGVKVKQVTARDREVVILRDGNKVIVDDMGRSFFHGPKKVFTKGSGEDGVVVNRTPKFIENTGLRFASDKLGRVRRTKKATAAAKKVLSTVAPKAAQFKLSKQPVLNKKGNIVLKNSTGVSIAKRVLRQRNNVDFTQFFSQGGGFSVTAKSRAKPNKGLPSRGFDFAGQAAADVAQLKSGTFRIHWKGARDASGDTSGINPFVTSRSQKAWRPSHTKITQALSNRLKALGLKNTFGMQHMAENSHLIAGSLYGPNDVLSAPPASIHQNTEWLAIETGIKSLKKKFGDDKVTIKATGYVHDGSDPNAIAGTLKAARYKIYIDGKKVFDHVSLGERGPIDVAEVTALETKVTNLTANSTELGKQGRDLASGAAAARGLGSESPPAFNNVLKNGQLSSASNPMFTDIEHLGTTQANKQAALNELNTFYDNL